MHRKSKLANVIVWNLEEYIDTYSFIIVSPKLVVPKLNIKKEIFLFITLIQIVLSPFFCMHMLLILVIGVVSTPSTHWGSHVHLSITQPLLSLPCHSKVLDATYGTSEGQFETNTDYMIDGGHESCNFTDAHEFYAELTTPNRVNFINR